jgi:hypothetical protein
VYPDGLLAVRLELYYAFADEIADEIRGAPVTWHMHNIPRADTAPTLILTGLAGALYAHTGQVQPLVVVREVLSTREAIARFGRGCRAGAAIVRWGDDASV